jgi:integrating conjugative element protein (TIGR03759 family)
MQYARKWARILHEDAERVLKFQAAYSTAIQELYGREAIIDTALLGQGSYSPVNAVQSGDRVLLFLRLENCPECQALYTRVRRAAFEVDAQLDIYFTDTEAGKDDKALIDWIANNRFDQNRLARNKVTFNHDGGALKRAGGAQARPPAAFRIRNELIDPLEIGMPGL